MMSPACSALIVGPCDGSVELADQLSLPVGDASDPGFGHSSPLVFLALTPVEPFSLGVWSGGLISPRAPARRRGCVVLVRAGSDFNGFGVCATTLAPGRPFRGAPPWPSFGWSLVARSPSVVAFAPCHSGPGGVSSRGTDGGPGGS